MNQFHVLAAKKAGVDQALVFGAAQRTLALGKSNHPCKAITPAAGVGAGARPSPRRFDSVLIQDWHSNAMMSAWKGPTEGTNAEFRASHGYTPFTLAHRLADHDDTPVGDNIVVLYPATWADYERLLRIRGDHSAPRMCFLEGAIEIMSPSHSRGLIKSIIGRLIESFCLENDVDFNPYGSWTLTRKKKRRAVEPDECYVFGEVARPKRPDLAIEVIWTNTGLDKLDIYAKIGVPEVWVWQRGQLTIHSLRGERYVEIARSKVLPGIDHVDLARFIDRPTASQAIRAYRASLRGRR